MEHNEGIVGGLMIFMLTGILSSFYLTLKRSEKDFPLKSEMLEITMLGTLTSLMLFVLLVIGLIIFQIITSNDERRRKRAKNQYLTSIFGLIQKTLDRYDEDESGIEDFREIAHKIMQLKHQYIGSGQELLDKFNTVFQHELNSLKTIHCSFEKGVSETDKEILETIQTVAEFLEINYKNYEQGILEDVRYERKILSELKEVEEKRRDLSENLG